MYKCCVCSLFVCCFRRRRSLFVFYFFLSVTLATGTSRCFASCVIRCFWKAQVAIRLSTAVIWAFNSEFLARMGHRLIVLVGRNAVSVVHNGYHCVYQMFLLSLFFFEFNWIESNWIYRIIFWLNFSKLDGTFRWVFYAWRWYFTIFGKCYKHSAILYHLHVLIINLNLHTK